MGRLLYIKYFQSILKDFDSIATSIKNLLLKYWENSLRPFIYTQLDKKDRNLDNWQAVVKEVIDAKANVTRQARLLRQKSNTRCFFSHISLKHKQSKKHTHSEVKKKNFPLAYSISKNSGQSSQALGSYHQHNSCSNRDASKTNPEMLW